MTDVLRTTNPETALLGLTNFATFETGNTIHFVYKDGKVDGINIVSWSNELDQSFIKHDFLKQRAIQNTLEWSAEEASRRAEFAEELLGALSILPN